MNDYQRLKQYLNKEVVASIVINCGFDVDKNYKFKIRDEKTPSTSINNQGYIKDFGGEFGGDIFAFLNEIVGYTKQEALQIVKNSLGVE